MEPSRQHKKVDSYAGLPGAHIKQIAARAVSQSVGTLSQEGLEFAVVETNQTLGQNLVVLHNHGGTAKEIIPYRTAIYIVQAEAIGKTDIGNILHGMIDGLARVLARALQLHAAPRGGQFLNLTHGYRTISGDNSIHLGHGREKAQKEE